MLIFRFFPRDFSLAFGDAATTMLSSISSSLSWACAGVGAGSGSGSGCATGSDWDTGSGCETGSGSGACSSCACLPALVLLSFFAGVLVFFSALAGVRLGFFPLGRRSSRAGLPMELRVERRSVCGVPFTEPLSKESPTRLVLLVVAWELLREARRAGPRGSIRDARRARRG